jgi:two-component sensor histidine kinase
LKTADWIRKASKQVPPNSLPAYALAVIGVTCAGAIRVVFGWIGADLPFAANFVAVLLVALVAGPEAGACAILLSIVSVWWAFVPPQWSFGGIDLGELTNLAFFGLMSSIVVWVAASYRNLLHAIEEHDRHRELVLSELNHRGRNTFAIVDSIVRISLDDLPERAREISDRVRAVSSTNDLINNAPLHRVTLDAILAKEFSPHGRERLRVIGDPVEIEPGLARNLSLIFHELVTNAAKYGALANKDGNVTVTCSVAGPNVCVRWQERGGPAVAPPTAFGFGSRLVTRILNAISGSIKPEFATDGLVCDITFSRH